MATGNCWMLYFTEVKVEKDMALATKAAMLNGDGMSFRKIANTLGLKHPQTAKNLVAKYLKHVTPTV